VSNILLAHTILSDNASITDVGNQNANHPATRLQFQQRTAKWQTVGLSSMNFIIDLGSNASWQLIALLGNNSSSTATWRIRSDTVKANLTTSPNYDSGNISMWPGSADLSTWDFINSVHIPTAAHADRYIRIDITDSSNPDGYFAAGRLFVSSPWIPAINMAYGSGLRFEDLTQKVRSLGGVAFATPRPRYRVFSFTLDFQSEAEMYGNAFEYDRLRGESQDILVSMDYEETVYTHAQLIHGLMKNLKPIVNTNYSIFRKQIEVEETL